MTKPDGLKLLLIAVLLAVVLAFLVAILALRRSDLPRDERRAANSFFM